MIIAGSDLSRGSDAALRLAAAWARERGSAACSLQALHALEGPAAALPARARGDVLASLAAQAALAGITDASACDGDACDVLAPRADRVIVVGAEGGSSTLMRRGGHVPATLAAELPSGARLLVAPLGWSAPNAGRQRKESRQRAPGPAWERIMVACALDSRDAALLELACEAASSSPRSEIHLVHVIDIATARHLPPEARAAVREATDAGALRAREFLQDLASEVIPMDLAARRDPRVHVVRQGPVERDLAGLASSQSIDLLVGGAGSVASRLGGFTPCALLVTG